MPQLHQHPAPPTPPPTEETAFRVISTLAEQTGLPRHYREDLDADRANLLDNPTQFIWIARAAGTVLLRYATPGSVTLAEYYGPREDTQIFLIQGQRAVRLAPHALMDAVKQLPPLFDLSRCDLTGYPLIRREDLSGVTSASVNETVAADLTVSVTASLHAAQADLSQAWAAQQRRAHRG